MEKWKVWAVNGLSVCAAVRLGKLGEKLIAPVPKIRQGSENRIKQKIYIKLYLKMTI